MPLTETERAILDLEGRGWTSQGLKEAAIRRELDLSPTRYYQALRALLERPEALEHDALTVNRLRRLRDGARRR